MVGEISELGFVSGRGRRLGQRLTKSNLNEIEKFLKTHKVDFKIHTIKGSEEISGFFLMEESLQKCLKVQLQYLLLMVKR